MKIISRGRAHNSEKVMLAQVKQFTRSEVYSLYPKMIRLSLSLKIS
jgi:hypothetical protein